MVNAIAQFFGIGSQWLFQSRTGSRTGSRAGPRAGPRAGRVALQVPEYFEVPGHRVAVNRIASIRINKGCVQFNRAEEPTLQISLRQDTSDAQLNTRHELVFTGDQADKALDALADCGYLDDMETRVKKRVFLNARFDYQDDLSNYHAIHSFVNQPTSGIH